MIDNPWHVDDMARMERERIQEEMRQIRMEQAANRPGRRPGGAGRILVQMLLALSRWISPAKKPASSPHPSPHVKLNGRHRARV